MTCGIVHDFPAGNQAQYEASIAAVRPGRDTPAQGQIFHAAGPSDGGWTSRVVHDSKKSWKKFRDEILMPRMRKPQHNFLDPHATQLKDGYAS